MPHITTCTHCGRAYEEMSAEAANAPVRECSDCWRQARRRRRDPAWTLDPDTVRTLQGQCPTCED